MRQKVSSRRLSGYFLTAVSSRVRKNVAGANRCEMVAGVVPMCSDFMVCFNEAV